VILEAFFFRIPVIATKVGGNVEIIEEGKTGLLVKYNDEIALIEAISLLLNNRVLAENFITQGVKRLTTDFEMSRMVREYEDVYVKSCQ
jgi:glycosyltransferase involved in cell wall biosynthesis